MSEDQNQSEIAKRDQWQKVYGYLLGYRATWIADIGLKAGLFQAIAAAGPAGIDEEALSQKLGLKLQYVRVWCRAAFAFEMLDWHAESDYQMAPHMACLLLDSSDPQFIGGRVQFSAALYEDFVAFPQYLKTGGIWPRSEHDPWLIQALMNQTKPDVVMITDAVLPQVGKTLSVIEAGGTILDIGAGAGYALVHYARRFPRARIVGLESDAPSLALARRTVADAGLTDRVELRKLDANRLDDENFYDLVTMNVVLHETGGPAEYRNVLARVRRALKPAGTLVVSELPYPDSPAAYRDEPVYQSLSAVQIHEALVGCGMITKGELRELLVSTGFSNVRVATQPLPTRFVMLAEK